MSLIIPDTQQKDLFEVLMKVSHGKRISTVKGAALNMLIAMICETAPSADEAIIQWNEISALFEKEIRRKYSRKGQFEFFRTRLNGG